MSDRDWEDHDEADDFGPGTDLVLSLLSVCILLLGLLGVRDLTAVAMPAPQAIVEMQSELKRLAEENARLKELLAQSKPRQEALVTVGEMVEVKGFEPFAKGQTQLAPSGRQAILRLIKEKVEEVASSGANVLQIEGHASPEPNRAAKASADVNLDLSALRAASVAHFLSESGVPYACMSAMGYGRARSRLISRFTSGGGNEALAKWDQLFNDATFRQQLQIRFDEALRADRRIVIRAVKDETSHCRPDQLLEGLRQAAGQH